MPEDKRHNFRKGRGVDFCQTKYDLKSAMHYSNTAFSSLRGKHTITAKDGTRLPPSWEKNDLSDGDVECLRRYYGCLGIVDIKNMMDSLANIYIFGSG